MDLKKVITPTAPVAPKVAVTQPVADVSDAFQDRVPSNWHLESVGDGIITGVSTRTNEQFKGTVAEFNRRIRG
jgi:hypothetical protein